MKIICYLIMRLLLTLITPILLIGCSNSHKYDLSHYKNTSIYYGGDIITVNDEQPETEAVLIGDGKIIAVGTKKEILSNKKSDTKLIDLKGKTMLPGFIDSHSHINMVSKYAEFTPAQGIVSIDTLVEYGKREVDKWLKKSMEDELYEPGDWFVGIGYDNTAFPNAIGPTASDIDKISEDIPICIVHTSNHIAVVNHKGLEMMGYIPGSPIVEKLNQWFGKNPDGSLNGLLEEEAFFRLYYDPNVMMDNSKTNSSTPEDILRRAMHIYASYGITTAQDGAGSDISQTVQNIWNEGDSLLIDINSYTEKEKMTEPSYESKYNKGFRTAGVKIYLDGSPQAKTAWLNEPYYIVPEGKPLDYRGYPQMTDDDLYNELVECISEGYQVYAHTNGTAAIDQFLNQYKKAKKVTGITTDLRPVFIHAQTMTEDQLDRAEKIGMDVSFFHDHTYYWGDYHLSSVLGPIRGARISPLATALQRDINVTMHQDSPVVPPNMIFSIHNAVNRVTRDGVPIGPEFAVDPLTAVKLVTIYGAHQYFQENDRGSIESGKTADFVILDQNPLKVKKSEIKNIQVLKTIKKGNTIYEK